MVNGDENAIERLKKERDLLKAIFDGVDTVIYAVDMGSRKVLYANRRAVDEFGDIRGETCHEALHGEETPCRFCEAGSLEDCDVRDSRAIEYQNGKNGSWYRSFVRFADWPDGRKVRLDVAVDVTSLRMFEDNLVKAQDEKSAIMENMAEHVVHYDSDMKIVWANRAALESVKRREEEVRGRSCAEVWYGRKAECPGCPVERSLETGRCEEGEIQTPDGRQWIISAAPMFNENGDRDGVIEVALDITDIRAAREERARASVFGSVIEAMPDQVIVFDITGKCIVANGAYCDAFGLSREDVMGKTIEEIPGFGMQDPDEIDRIAPLMQRAVQDGEKIYTELTLKKYDGTIVKTGVSGGAVRDASGNPTHIVATLRPIT